MDEWNGWMGRPVDARTFFLPHWIGNNLVPWQAIQQRQVAQVDLQTCLIFRSFLIRGYCMGLAACFLLHQYGNFGIWLKCWYFVLFLSLVLTFPPWVPAEMPAGPLAQLTPSSLPLDGSANPPYCLALLWTRMAPCRMMFTQLPCLFLHSPSLASNTAQSHVRREPGLNADLEGRQCIRLSGAFPCVHGTAKTML